MSRKREVPTASTEASRLAPSPCHRGGVPTAFGPSPPGLGSPPTAPFGRNSGVHACTQALTKPCWSGDALLQCDGANRLVETVGGDRERVHLAAPGQIEPPPRRTRRDSAAVDGSSPPAAYPVSLKSHRRLLAAECRRRARRRTTRMGSSTRMRSATYAQSKPRQLQATRSRRRRQGQNINAGDDLS